jgi:hypothetical protein
MREGTDKYDDKEQGGYDYGEKLALVAQGLMDPKSIGLPPGDDGQRKAYEEITGKPTLAAKLGDFVTFEASTIPNEIRAHWARQELKVIPAGLTAKEWELKWIDDHKGEVAVQGTLHSGTCHSVMQRLYTDPILGFANMLRGAAEMLEQKYEELKKNDPEPIIYRETPTARQAPVAPKDEQQTTE